MAKRDRRQRSSRKTKKRATRRYLIVSEDAKSSIDYFLSFPHDPAVVEIVPEGGAGNTRSVVEKAIKLRDEAKRNKEPFVHVYCVFDRDDHPEERYRAAFNIARSHNDITAIWANECYELWLMLHFRYHNTGIGREDIYKFLNTKFDGDYDKGSSDAYNLTCDKIDAAIRNANKLAANAREEDSDSPWMVNPSTNIQDLVAKLQELNELDTNQ